MSEELRCGIEISAGLPKYVFLILRKSFAWHWCLFYRGGVVAIHPLRGCDAIFEGVDQSEKMEVLTVTMSSSTIAS